jgi:hypothetical protein
VARLLSVSALIDRSSYCVLRVCADADAYAWWLEVRQRRDVPEAISVLLGGRTRVELSREDAERALEWAARIDGWAAAETKPLCVYSVQG